MRHHTYQNLRYSCWTFFLCLLLFGCGGKKKETKISQKSPSPQSQPKKEPNPQVPSKAPAPDSNKGQKVWENMEGIYGLCEGSKSNLAIPINSIAQNISRDSLEYDVEPYSDCSGIFLRVLDSLSVRCPGNKFPNPKSYRDSRALARWYHEQKLLVRVSDPLEMMEYLKPGAVMFYGARGADTDTLSLQALFQHGGINHVGVITSIDQDKKGIIKGYSLFHGQRPGKRASITKYHKRKYRNRSEYPPYGNGSEQWVAVAPIVKPAN